ncbi:MAG TPA: hypothetical protein PKH78_04170 [Candidatus Obscuribacter sp.]|nr:hypothetical protein [Candidatus Obscuribacter sp.]
MPISNGASPEAVHPSRPERAANTFSKNLAGTVSEPRSRLFLALRFAMAPRTYKRARKKSQPARSRLLDLLLLPPLLSLTICGTAAQALDGATVDKEIVARLEKISKLQNSGDDFEKLEGANSDLLKYLKATALKPEAMTIPLKKAAESGLSVFTSDDKKVRCYSWDTLTGGTMHVFYSFISYDAGNKQIKCLVLNPSGTGSEGDPGSTIEALDTFTTKDGKTVYVTRDLFIGSGLIHGRTIKAYTITGGALKKHTFFQAGKLLLSEISFDFAEYEDGTEFELSKDKKTLKVPLIKPAAKDSPGSGKATGKFLNYYFDGYHFIFKK